MQLQTLKLFCDVVRLSSFSRGARENGVSQSTASQSVNQLEQHLGVKLIDRSKRPFQLTEKGREYHDGCRDLISRYGELEDRIRGLADERRLEGTVRVASIYSAGLNHIQQFARRFHERNPEARVRVDYLHPTRVVEAVVGGEAELGLISFPKKRPDLDVTPWREEEMVLAVPPSHRLASRGSVAVRELEGETFVGFDADLSIRRAIDRFLKNGGVHVDVACEFDNIESIKHAVEVVPGVAILPRPTLSGEVRNGTLVAIPFDETRLTRPLAIIRRRSEPLGRTASQFLRLLRTGAEPSSKPVAAAPAAEAVLADGHQL